MKPNVRALTGQLRHVPAVQDFLLSKNTTIGIGGRAPLAFYPRSCDEICEVLAVLAEYDMPFQILGNGSNVLASDAGYSGVIVKTDNLTAIRAEGEIMAAESGASIASILAAAKEIGLGGLSFMAGIPASLGGALFMNAGARGHYIGSEVVSVNVFEEGKICILSAKDCKFSYKHTRFMENSSIILSARLRFRSQSPQAVSDEIQETLAFRSALPKGRSMGCVFKNGPSYSAGELIDRVGLKGVRCGGAIVSSQHANFIINCGGATSEDVMRLICIIKEKVLSETGVELAEEIRYIGEF